ncbi:hypothetical protein FA15DRAFT_470912 [Coprinopsis marcescibilis]|uniref:Mediator of RNA polymerase II transcription subunit 17 n=1 Tax=Coprinopsis marcescibilis TaxID=230819 RepID=A0A5C3KRS4_COPMA|nr:hypothetical protein FA15DRAFT_470912 [Coprinopsis marcescibilis]
MGRLYTSRRKRQRNVSRTTSRVSSGNAEDQIDTESNAKDESLANESRTKPMTYEEVQAMRLELMAPLSVAMGQMTQARNILDTILSTTNTASRLTEPQKAALTGTIVTQPSPIPALQAFNAQLVIGSKDAALRKASHLFNTVAGRMERVHERSEQYWINALKIRRNNWRLLPSPLPPGSFIGKGADRTARDFVVAYGLEESSATIRRRGLAHLSDVDGESNLIFANRQELRMRVYLCYRDSDGRDVMVVNSAPKQRSGSPDDTLEDTLMAAQRELVDEEIFSSLIYEASNLTTALARVSERLIVIDASEGVELRFELGKESTEPGTISPLCDLVYHGLRVLLLRKHAYVKNERLNASGNFPSNASPGYTPMLKPIIDLLQYKVFSERLQTELSRAAAGLNTVGIPTSVSYNAVGESGEDTIKIFCEPQYRNPSGEAILRIDNKNILRLTFAAPSTLTVHLTQATLQIYSLPQLSHLLRTEIERFILQRICVLGERIRGETWFIDLDRLVARWEGSALTFRISFDSEMNISCSAFLVNGQTGRRGNLLQYSHLNGVPLLSWIETVINNTSTS